MESKLRQLMKHEGINSTRLAEIMGIQASGVSHIMSGRNKPSFDFLLKLLQRFPQINPDWLLLDKGPMYRGEIKNKSVNTYIDGQQQGDGNQRGGGSVISGGAPGGDSGHAPIGGHQAESGVSARPGGFVSDIAAPYNADGVVNMGTTSAFRELFEPDNTDIIPSGAQTSGHTSQPTAQPAAQQTPQQAIRPPAQHAPQPVPQAPQSHSAQQPVYQSSGFTRSAMIERIVVFYKDKTFSEYQPG
jgi:transcriptional regulator with XRE-family HTH domain